MLRAHTNTFISMSSSRDFAILSIWNRHLGVSPDNTISPWNRHFISETTDNTRRVVDAVISQSPGDHFQHLHMARSIFEKW